MKEKIAYITDIHLDEKFPIDLGVNPRDNWNVILNDISSRGITKIIFGGDIGEVNSNQWFFESLSQFDINIILGNHDTYNEVQKYFFKSEDTQKKELFYNKEGVYHSFIFLDSSSGEISPNQLDWFKNKLNTEKDILIFIHHPIIPIDAEVDKQYGLRKRHLIEVVLQNIKNSSTIFSGHYHFDDKKTKGNIVQYVTPASSYQVEKIKSEIKVHKDSFGYRIIELNGKKINTDLILFSSTE